MSLPCFAQSSQRERPYQFDNRYRFEKPDQITSLVTRLRGHISMVRKTLMIAQPIRAVSSINAVGTKNWVEILIHEQHRFRLRNGQMSFRTIKDDTIEIILGSGMLFASIAPGSKLQTVTVHTPTFVTGISGRQSAIGTEFLVAHEDKQSYVLVTDGEVDVISHHQYENFRHMMRDAPYKKRERQRRKHLRRQTVRHVVAGSVLSAKHGVHFPRPRPAKRYFYLRTTSVLAQMRYPYTHPEVVKKLTESARRKESESQQKSKPSRKTNKIRNKTPSIEKRGNRMNPLQKKKPIPTTNDYSF